MATTSCHVWSLESAKPHFDSPLGSIRKCTVKELPILNGMSLKRLTLQPKAIREVHWHSNTNELTYCLSGAALINIIDTHSSFNSFTISAGQMFHVKSGSLHHIENISDTEKAEFLVCFRHEDPKDFSLSASLGAMSPAVLGNTYGVPASAFDGVKFSTQSKEIIEREGKSSIPDSAAHLNVHKFDVEGSEPWLKGERIGSAKLAKASTWPAPENVAIIEVELQHPAPVNPDWKFPHAAELGYVDKGMARMTILDPDGSTDTYTLKPGDMYFIPRTYPHPVEVLPEGGKEIHFCIFFDQPMPQDIGYKASVEGMPHELMAATLGLKRSEMPKLQGTTGNPLLVKRINAIDEVKVWTQSKL